MRNLMGEVFDERVRPFMLAMAANREGGDTTRHQQNGKGRLEHSKKLRREVSIFSIIMENCAEFLRIRSFRIAL
jgi:hypothetical protein